jgi:transposase
MYHARSFENKINGLTERWNAQLDLFDNSVTDHTVAARLLCRHRAPKARCMMNLRQARGLEIATTQPITQENGVWIVPSQASSKTYTVNLHIQTCTCADFEAHRVKCKHIHAAEAALRHEQGLDIPVPEKRIRVTYKQQWEAYNKAQTHEKEKFQELLYALCQNIEDLPRKNANAGRSRLPLGEMIFAVCFKVFSLVSGRRFISDLREAQRRGYISKTPHFNSIFNYLELPEMTACLKDLIIESSLPLKTVEFDFAVDSSGFSTGIYQKWSEAKWGGARTVYGDKQPNEVNRMDWLKVHLMCGVKTNIVTSVEVTSAHAGDYPQFAPLVNQTSRNFVMNEVSADKGYSGSKNLQLVLVKGAQPYIDFKSNATANSTDKRQTQVWKRMYHFYQYNQAEFMRHYHKRSNVETTFSMIKGKFGERLRSKTETAQKNEVLCKILCHNLCCLVQSMYELGIDADFSKE